MKLSTLLVAAYAAVAVNALCDATTGWCDFGTTLSAHYECKDLVSCISSKIALRTDKSKYITLKYNLPALQDGMTGNWTEFALPPFSSMVTYRNADDNKAWAGLGAPLAWPQNPTVPVGYLAVLQGMAFKDFSLGGIPAPEIPEFGIITPCLTTKVEGKCTEKPFKAGEFKWSFAGFQVSDCQKPAECSFVMRTEIDTTTAGTDDIKIMAGTVAYTLAAPPAWTVAVTAITVGGFNFAFPTGVNLNNESYNANGATVHVEKVMGKKISLAFKLKAPGAGKFAAYDPTVAFTIPDCKADGKGVSCTSAAFSTASAALIPGVAALLGAAAALLL